MDKIRLAAPLQMDSTVDGYGIRTVIWTQGCSHACPFCHNPGTHAFDGGVEYDVEDICNELYEIKNGNTQTGITFSGGDPMFQVEAVEKIAKYAKEIGFNVWCYSGFTYEQILELGKKNPHYLELLKYIDVLVDGRFEIDKQSYNVLFRGSTNQRLVDVPATLKNNNKVAVIPETDGILEKYEVKEKLYI